MYIRRIRQFHSNILLKKNKKPNLFEIIEKLPKPKEISNKPMGWAKQVNKNGIGLKFTRDIWDVYEEPCYWEITRYKPKNPDPKLCQRPVAWGLRTFRGQTSEKEKRISRPNKRGWRLYE